MSTHTTITDRRAVRETDTIAPPPVDLNVLPTAAPLGATQEAQQPVLKWFFRKWGFNLMYGATEGIESIKVKHLEKFVPKADRDKLADIVKRLHKLESDRRPYTNDRAKLEHQALRAKASAEPSAENLKALENYDVDTRQAGFKESRRAISAAIKAIEDSEYLPLLEVMRHKILPEIAKAIAKQETIEKEFSESLGITFNSNAPSRPLQCLRWTFAKLHLPAYVYELSQDLRQQPAK